MTIPEIRARIAALHVEGDKVAEQISGWTDKRRAIAAEIRDLEGLAVQLEKTEAAKRAAEAAGLQVTG